MSGYVWTNYYKILPLYFVSGDNCIHRHYLSTKVSSKVFKSIHKIKLFFSILDLPRTWRAPTANRTLPSLTRTQSTNRRSAKTSKPGKPFRPPSSRSGTTSTRINENRRHHPAANSEPEAGLTFSRTVLAERAAARPDQATVPWPYWDEVSDAAPARNTRSPLTRCQLQFQQHQQQRQQLQHLQVQLQQLFQPRILNREVKREFPENSRIPIHRHLLPLRVQSYFLVEPLLLYNKNINNNNNKNKINNNNNNFQSNIASTKQRKWRV